MDCIKNYLTYSTTITDTSRGGKYCLWGNITCDSTIGDAAKLLLQSLGLLPLASDDIHASQGTWYDNAAAERFFFSGCCWSSPGGGLGSFNGGNARSDSYHDVGFRAAFVKL
jgi:hypothetical protein